MTLAELEALQPIHAAPTSAWSRYIFSTDHKVIAKQFLWAGLSFLLLGGLLAMLIRWQWAFPGRAVPLVGATLFAQEGGALSAADYPKVFTSHGLVMIFFAVTPILIGAFGNFLIPLLIGARDMAFPRANAASFWLFAGSGGVMLASFLPRLGTASTGWTSYPPLSTHIGTPGIGQSLVLGALFLNGLSTILGGVNYLTTVIRFRAPGLTWMRLPATVWGLWLTAVLNVLFVPVLGSATLLLLCDRHLGTQFFIAGANATSGGGDPLAYQHLFWIFGHPEVYVLILPAWGIVTDLLSHFARAPAFWYRGAVGSLIAVTALSGLVYGHHMYVAGMNPMLGQGFMLLTLAISLPALVLGLTWLQTLWRGRARFHSPMLFALGVVFVFGIGGFTGLFLGDMALDLYLHDTMYVVGHFHFTMAAATFLALLAGIYFWFPKMFARQLDERLAKAHFWVTLVGLTLVFGGQLIAGWAGQPRRLFDPFEYTFVERLRTLNYWTSMAAFGLLFGQLLFIYNVIATLLSRKTIAKENPWGVGTLEWTCTSTPVAFHNFDRIPTVVRGPHAYGEPSAQEQLGRDWLGQAEPLGPERRGG
jgi:cytochrome c oxidase subunit 1